MRQLNLSGNTQLTGSLSAALAASQLTSLRLNATGLSGSVPSGALPRCALCVPRPQPARAGRTCWCMRVSSVEHQECRQLVQLDLASQPPMLCHALRANSAGLTHCWDCAEWYASGSFSELQDLDISSNPQLTGRCARVLPCWLAAALPWLARLQGCTTTAPTSAAACEPDGSPALL